jgi:hypothetical protein
MPEQKCPLCDTYSVYSLTTDYGRGKYFKCDRCKHFVIRENAENLLKEAPGGFTSELSVLSSGLSETELLFIACDINGKINPQVQPRDNWC